MKLNSKFYTNLDFIVKLLFVVILLSKYVQIRDSRLRPLKLVDKLMFWTF